jgi:hypothetical protein
MRRISLASALALVLAAPLFPIDYGFILSTQGEFVADAGERFSFTGGAAPWLYAALGEQLTLYVSGKASFSYGSDANEWSWPPLLELERTELILYPARSGRISLGRQWFGDGMIAQGYFDGLHAEFSLGRIRLNGGVFYTGFLYKTTAEILMSGGDHRNYNKPLDYGDGESYFASRRVFTTLAGEFPDLSPRTSLSLLFLAQFDLNDYWDSYALHSQYLEARFDLDALETLRFNIAAVGGMAESEAATRVNLAADLGTEWNPPGSLLDMLSAKFRWGSGAISEEIGPFRPINNIAQGSVFAPPLPGIMNARLNYTARPHRVVSLSAGSVFFWRTDLETFADEEMDADSKDRFLGGEAFGQLLWSPQSALRLSVDGGVFFPGGAFKKNTKNRWKFAINLILSL